MNKYYIFEYLGKKIAFEPESLTPFEVDATAEEAITLLDMVNQDEIIQTLSKKIPKDEAIILMDQLYSIGENIDKNPIPSKTRTVTAWLQISHDCNLRCKYCFAGSGSFHGERSLMKWPIAKAACDYLLKRYTEEADALVIVFFGGEPLMNVTLIKKIFEYCKNKNHEDKPITFTISSNATLLDESLMAYLTENNIGIMCSIDGPREIHDAYRPFPDGSGSFTLASANASKFLEYRDAKLVQVEATYSREDFNLIDRKRALRSLGFNFIKFEAAQLEPSHPLSIRKEDLPLIEVAIRNLALEYRDDIRKGLLYKLEPFGPIMKMIRESKVRRCRCLSGEDDLAIACDGRIFPCTRLAGIDEWAVGNVYEAINPKKASIWVTTHSYEARSGCNDCWVRNICGGGCRVDSIESERDIFKPYDTHCEMYKYYTQAAIWLLSELDDDTVKMVL